MLRLKTTSRGLSFAVYVLPKSAKAAIMGIHQQALKIKLTAAPVQGAANKQCIQVLAKALSLPKSALTIIGGKTSRMKQVMIQTQEMGLDDNQIKILKKKIFLLGEKSI